MFDLHLLPSRRKRSSTRDYKISWPSDVRHVSGLTPVHNTDLDISSRSEPPSPITLDPPTYIPNPPSLDYCSWDYCPLPARPSKSSRPFPTVEDTLREESERILRERATAPPPPPTRPTTPNLKAVACRPRARSMPDIGTELDLPVEMKLNLGLSKEQMKLCVVSTQIWSGKGERKCCAVLARVVHRVARCGMPSMEKVARADSVSVTVDLMHNITGKV